MDLRVLPACLGYRLDGLDWLPSVRCQQFRISVFIGHWCLVIGHLHEVSGVSRSRGQVTGVREEGEELLVESC